MKTKVVLTVDTEPSVAGAFANPKSIPPLIHEPVWGDVNGRSEALGFMIRTLSDHGLTATFFVETAHTSYFSSTPMGTYVNQLAEAEQDVQLHLHPVWLKFESENFTVDPSMDDQCHLIDRDQLSELVSRGTDQIEAWTGRQPTCMRTGNFSNDASLFSTIRDAGLKYTSNICAALPATDDPALRLPGGVHELGGVSEFPVTCFIDRGPVGRGRLRPLQVTACGFSETRSILEQLNSSAGEVAIIVTHPFEFLRFDDYRFSNMRPNRLVQRRFNMLCKFLANNTDRFETVTLEEAGQSLNPGQQVPQLVGNPALAILRAAQNVVYDRLA
ncbi:MAG: hypothetical protein GKS01_05000 [Alphaproteobacteria bacterium]|nr:hypothetical protein [Alphaproteobacteria bacterium]